MPVNEEGLIPRLDRMIDWIYLNRGNYAWGAPWGTRVPPLYGIGDAHLGEATDMPAKKATLEAQEATFTAETEGEKRFIYQVTAHPRPSMMETTVVDGDKPIASVFSDTNTNLKVEDSENRRKIYFRVATDNYGYSGKRVNTNLTFTIEDARTQLLLGMMLTRAAQRQIKAGVAVDLDELRYYSDFAEIATVNGGLTSVERTPLLAGLDTRKSPVVFYMFALNAKSRPVYGCKVLAFDEAQATIVATKMQREGKLSFYGGHDDNSIPERWVALDSVALELIRSVVQTSKAWDATKILPQEAERTCLFCGRVVDTTKEKTTTIYGTEWFVLCENCGKHEEFEGPQAERANSFAAELAKQQSAE